MVSANDKILDRTIRHMVFLERYKASEIRKLLKILNTELIPEITKKIEKRLLRIRERGTDTGPETMKRLKDLERELQALVRAMSDRLKADMTTDMTQLTRDEINWQARVVRESVGFNIEMTLPPPRTVAALVKRTSFSGLTIDQWFDSLSRSTQKNVMIAVQRGIVQGETVDQIMRRIRGTRALNYTDGIMQTTRNQASTLARTTINHVSNQSRLEFFKENDDIISGLKWVATLDSRTSLTCAGLDGKVFPIDKGPRPPAHPNCRSTMTAVLKDADEIGLDKIPEGKRSSMNGQVPASTTYGQWLKKQPKSVQEQVLGVEKAELFRQGKVSIEQFTGANLKPLNLDQLRKLEKTDML